MVDRKPVPDPEGGSKLATATVTEEHLTGPGVAIGTAAYMSPEQARGEDLDARTDLFSFGVLLFEMATGTLPFKGNTSAVLFDAILNRAPIAPTQFNPELPADLERITQKALEKDREVRYQSARDLLADLKRMKRARDLKQAPGSEPSRGGRLQALETPEAASLPSELSSSPPSTEDHRLEPVGGAVPLNSRFYVTRPVDEAFQIALGRWDSIVLVKGPRQVGKTSLLARGLQRAREIGARVVLTDLQKLDGLELQSANALYLALAGMLAEQLACNAMPDKVWDSRRSPNVNFERYLRREVLSRTPSHLVWGLDEVDRIFPCGFASEVFGLLRSWHNERSLDPRGHGIS